MALAVTKQQHKRPTVTLKIGDSKYVSLNKVCEIFTLDLGQAQKRVENFSRQPGCRHDVYTHGENDLFVTAHVIDAMIMVYPDDMDDEGLAEVAKLLKMHPSAFSVGVHHG